MLAEVNPELAAPHDGLRAPSGMALGEAMLDGECQRGLEQLRMLLSHVDPHLTLGKLVGRLMQDGLDRYDPTRTRRRRRTTVRASGTAEQAAGAQGAKTTAPSRTSAAKRHARTAHRGRPASGEQGFQDSTDSGCSGTRSPP